MQDEKGVLKLVRDCHPPLSTGLQFSIYALQNSASGNGSFPPRGMLVRQLLAFVVRFVSFVGDVKEVARHGE
jgi:hypothetical protein